MADSTVKPDDTNDLVLQNNHGDSKIEVNEDDTIVVTSGGDFTIDATGDIILDAGGADVTLKDGGTTFGSLKQASGHLVIQPTSSKQIILNEKAANASLTVDTSDQHVSINNGSIVISTAGEGITFGGDPDSRVNSPTVGDRTLYDYEQGTWSAAIAVDTSGSITINEETGSYVKIGKSVLLNGRFTISSVTSPVGDVSITGLPFTTPSAAHNPYHAAVTVALDNITGTLIQTVGIIPEGASIILVREMLTGGAGNDVGAHITANSTFNILATYQAA